MKSQYETFNEISTYNGNVFLLCIMRKSNRNIKSNRFKVMVDRNKERYR